MRPTEPTERTRVYTVRAVVAFEAAEYELTVTGEWAGVDVMTAR